MGPDELMDQADVARRVGVTTDTLRSSRAAGRARYADMPPPLREVSGRPVWLRRDIEAWMAGRVHELYSYSTPTADGYYPLVRAATVAEFQAAVENGRRGGLPGLVEVGGDYCFVRTRPGAVFRSLDEVRANVAVGARVEVRQGAKVAATGTLVGVGGNYVELRQLAEVPTRLVDWRPGTTLVLLRQGQPTRSEDTT